MNENLAIKAIKNSIKQKYKNSVYSKTQIKNILKFRRKILKKKLSSGIIYKSCLDIKINKNYKKYLLSNILKKLYQKSNLTIKDKLKIFNFYKKFSANLKLFRVYDINLKKKSSLETGFESYVFLGDLLFKIHAINKIQRLNCLLKLNDKILINNNIYKDFLIFKLFKENLKKELHLINYYLNK